MPQEGIDLTNAAQASIEAGDYDQAMSLLEEADQVDPSFAKVTTNMRHQISALQEEVPTSAGTSFSTSESRPEQSGTSLPDTELSSQSPAQETENPSSEDPVVSPASSSTVPSVSGSSQETGQSQPSLSDSSEGSQSAKEPTVGQPEDQVDPAALGAELLGKAKAAYEAGDYDNALSLLSDAKDADPSLAENVAAAQAIVEQAKAGHETALD